MPTPVERRARTFKRLPRLNYSRPKVPSSRTFFRFPCALRHGLTLSPLLLRESICRRIKCKARAFRCQFDLIKEMHELAGELIARCCSRFNTCRRRTASTIGCYDRIICAPPSSSGKSTEPRDIDLRLPRFVKSVLAADLLRKSPATSIHFV
ncbi:hypothetical protein PUN28_014994 [Cardiocondyla obscurior]|uniref:Uncharacterized protein n=1 Tax=Cardiocondyla obscurior TaxID=286306 RepID=A0AAW2F078_9HYME